MMYELKNNINEKTKSLNSSLINIENTANKLKIQHNSISEKMKTMNEEFEDILLSVNNSYFHELKILEDNIHVLVSESGKSPWLDIFYLMMSYVIAGIMFIFWFLVACFKLGRKILSLSRTLWGSANS
ncbi:hypothetical protein C2G38_1746319 [Gigaspora rosea]|uniref:Uncharacterized protein n=2 Tax=Gigaspora rosea TaxID=44941 RepID=A0A397UST3_9GLOM|nr:hypothetical protein C2G38_1746319 [Gigaspora rosea]